MEVSASIVGHHYAGGGVHILESLNVFELRRDGVLFVVAYAEEEDDRLSGSDDGFCFGDVYVIVNGQYVDVRLSGGV